MVTGNFNSLAFFRAYYHIPASRKLAWALIVEQAQGLQKVRLGVVFCQQPHVYIDVAMRRFFTEAIIGNGMLSRRVFPARRIARQDEYLYVTDNGLSAAFSKSYIRDIYFTAVYSPELMRQVLY